MVAPIHPDKNDDPFRPPAVPVEVQCLHCGEEYESYRIEWRESTGPDGRPQGFWCCPTPGCDGKGFGFDILPTDPTYRDERGGWCCDDCEDEEEDDEFDGQLDDAFGLEFDDRDLPFPTDDDPSRDSDDDIPW